MSNKFVAEVCVTTVIGIAVFGWVFSQSPIPEHSKIAKADVKVPIMEDQVGKRSDQIPTVGLKAPKQTTDLMKVVALQPVDLGPPPAEILLEVTATNLKLRSGPSPTMPSISIYARGSTFEKIGQEGDWLQVRSTEDGASGWMFAEYLQSPN